MLFHLKPDTECELTTFVGRTQKSGPDDVPAVSIRLLLQSVPNHVLDLFSATFRHTAYMAVEGQEQLPGVEDTTPILRSKDLKHWAPETRLEGWKVIIARGIDEDSALQMGSCKLDDFKFDLYEGGHVDVDFRISTADVDEEGAGMLWGRQKRKVFATILAPEVPPPKQEPIDGTKGHPGADSGAADATDLFASGGDPDSDEDEDSEGGATDLEERLDNALARADAPSEPARDVQPLGGASGARARSHRARRTRSA